MLVTDIDECQIGEARCRNNEACVNLPGSFECRQVCPRGYRFAGELANGVPNCVDIDECTTNESVCPVEAICINEPGSFRCQCSDGQAPVGHSCLGLFAFISFTRLYPNKRTCKDNNFAFSMPRIGFFPVNTSLLAIFWRMSKCFVEYFNQNEKSFIDCVSNLIWSIILV